VRFSNDSYTYGTLVANGLNSDFFIFRNTAIRVFVDMKILSKLYFPFGSKFVLKRSMKYTDMKNDQIGPWNPSKVDMPSQTEAIK
jgi:hypothetical protein